MSSAGRSHLLGVGLCVLIGVAIGVGTASLESRHAVSIEVLVGDGGSLATGKSRLMRAGVPASAFEVIDAAPLLPGGAAALRAVQARAARATGVPRVRVADDVRVSDSDDKVTFDRDKPSDHRLRIVANAPDEARARRLAVAFATAYARHRERFYVHLADSLDVTHGAAGERVAAERWTRAEKGRLNVLTGTVNRAGQPSPHPIRNGVLAGLACLLALALVQILRALATS